MSRPSPAPQWRGQASIRGPNESVRMALLTCSLIGMVFTWSLEMSYCTPYLLELGLTKSKTSLVWIAGPLSSLVVQPIVGAIADRSTSRFGRRRPFMIGSAAIVGLSLIMLGWAKNVVGLFMSGESPNATVVLAVLSIYCVDIAINVLQASSRGLIVDTLPREHQQTGAAWDARMGATGHIVAYFIGTLDLVSFLPSWLGGDSQFKKMTVVAAFAVWAAVATTSWAVSERVLLKGTEKADSAYVVLSTLWHHMRDLPPRVRAICQVQFWSWIGWFPFLFYGTTWVGETYFRYEYNEAQDGKIDDVLGQVGRLGSTALVIYSFVTFSASLILPNLVQSPKARQDQVSAKAASQPPSSTLASIQAAMQDLAAVRPRLVTAWMCSEIFFAAIFIWAPFVRSLPFASLLVALAGIPWTVTVWAPLAEMGVEIDRLASGVAGFANNPEQGDYAAVPGTEDDQQLSRGTEMDERQTWHDRHSYDDLIRDRELGPGLTSASGKLSGIYLGVLNAYTTLPQFVGTAISWVVFSVFEPKRSTDPKDSQKWLNVKKSGPNAIAICLFVGALSAGMAAYMAWKLRRIG